MEHRRIIFCTTLVLFILIFGSVFEENIHHTIEAQLSTTLQITKLTTGGNDAFDFTVSGPTSYNPSIITTGSGGGGSPITYIDTLSLFDTSRDFSGSPHHFGQLMTFPTAQSISSIRFHVDSSEFNSGGTGTLQGVIYSGVSVNSPSFTQIGTSVETFQAPWDDDGAGGTFISDDPHDVLFTFDPPVTVSGSGIFIGVLASAGCCNGDLDFFTSTVEIGGNEGTCVTLAPELSTDFKDYTAIVESLCYPNPDIVMKIETSSGGGGMGMDGPTPVDPGTYFIQESIPAGWSLTDATCNDGSSSFSVDTVSGIVIDPGDNIECTFENELPDSDGDGISNEVDILPDTASDDFSDITLGGTSSGTITARGDQILTITKEPNPSGVRIDADISGGTTPATVSVCGGISTINLSPGDEIVVTCGSATIDVINGPVDVTFISSGGTHATTTLTEGNSITFEPDTFSFVVPLTNTQIIIIDIQGEQVTLNPGETISLGFLQITKQATGGNDNFIYLVTGPTSFDTNIETTGGGPIEGMGRAGPTLVEAGTYQVQEETFSLEWILTNAACNDGFSSFSGNTITGIVIDPGDNIECLFENQFVVLIPDSDGDGISNEVDTLPDTASDDFSDITLGGTSSGTITARGDQILTITKEPNPSGVRIAADISGGLLPAVVNACGGISIITLSPGDEIVVTCGSVIVKTITGEVEVVLIASDGTQASTSIPNGNEITFDPQTSTINTNPQNTGTIVIMIGNTLIPLSPGSSGFSDIEPPEITINSLINDEDSFNFGNVPPEPTCIAQDDLSGVDGGCSVIGYQTGVGTHQIQFSASDLAGNTNTITLDYQVLPWSILGFYHPVDMGEVINTVKGGSTVPLKFEIFAGSIEKTSTSDISSFTQNIISCSTLTGNPEDAIEITTTDSTGLKYTSEQFIANWKTPKSPDTCWKVKVTTNDGSSLSAFFKLK